MNLAVRDVRHNLGRFGLTCLGVGMLLMIVMGMGGIYRGIIEDAVLLIDRIGADVWVVQRATRGPFAELSRVPPSLVHRVAAVPGVRSAREFVFHTIQRERHGKPLRIAVVGLSWPEDRGAWLPLIQGRPLAQARYELVADRSLGLAVGERIQLGRETYTVVGLTTGMIASGGDGIAFATVRDAQTIQLDTTGEAVRLEREARRIRARRDELPQVQPSLVDRAGAPSSALAVLPRPTLTAVLAELEPGADPEQVRAVLSGWGDVTAYTSEAQRDLLLQGNVAKVRAQIGLFRALLTIIAAIIMALILYTLTLDKLHDIALLKLIGAPNRVILALILQQAVGIGLIGYGVAYALGQQLFPRFPRRVILTQPDLLQLAGIVAFISVLASLLGIWKALRVSPSEALSG